MADGFLFSGSFTRRPSVRALVDDTGLNPFQIGSPRIVAIVGLAEGGIPKVPVLFTTPSDARASLRNGELLDSVLRAFAPSSDQSGAAQIYAVRVNPATQSALTLKDGSAANAIDLKSVNYGQRDNQVKVKVESGTTLGKKVTVGFKTDLIAKDNLQRDSFQIQYTGAGSAATLTINGTTLTTAITGGPGGEALNITLSSYPDIQSLVDFIGAQALGVYAVSVKTPNGAQPTVNGLDFVTAVTIKAAPVVVTATLQAVIDWFNSGEQTYVSATRSSGAGGIPTNVAFTYLSGGAEGTTINSDWQTAIDALQTKDVALLAAASGDATIHAMVATHCQNASADGRRPRRAILGGVLGEYTATLSNYTARALALNSDRVALAAQGVQGVDSNGNLVMFPPYVLGAQLAGLQAGVPEIGNAITFKSINAAKLEWNPTAAEQEILIAGGVIPVEFVDTRNFFRVVRGISTWRKNDSFARVEFSTGMALDEVVRDVIEGLERFIGEKASPVLVSRVASGTQSILKGLQQAGVIVGDDTSPAFSGISVQLAGDTVRVQFNCQPAVPVNFVGITVHANTFTGSVTVAVDG